MTRHLLLSHRDLPSPGTRAEVEAHLRLEDLAAEARKSRQFQVVETSAKTGDGVNAFRTWLTEKVHRK